VGAHAPVVAGLPVPLAAGVAHYTTRLLRCGYVNVYDVARKRWETYYVTPDGYLFKLFQTPGVTPAVPAKPFDCPDEGDRAVAGCITIADPKNASTIWVGFSDVLWTDAVRELNGDSAYRKRHMVEICVKAALAGAKLAATQPISKVETAVAEYAIEQSQAVAAFSWNPFKFDVRRGRAARLKQEFEVLRPGKGLIVTVPDPAGVVQELAFLMKRNVDAFSGKPEHRRNLAASTAIDQIKTAVRTQAENDEIAAAEQLVNQQLSENPLGNWLSEATRKQTEEMRDVSSVQLNRAADNAWARYTKKFDDPARSTWQAKFDEALATYGKTHIAPLAAAHVAWMKSTALADYFQCNYDSNHAGSGAVYAAVFTRCISATQDKQVCANLYDEWLAGSVDDPQNILLRAMVLHQAPIIEAVKKAIEVSFDLRQVPWDNIFATYKTAVERLSNGEQEISGRLLAEIAGPLARMLGKVMDGSAGFRHAIMATGLISGHPVIVCELTGSRKAFRALLIRQLLRSSGQVINENQMQRAVAAELRRQQIHGAPLDGTTKKRWVMLADQEMIANMPRGLSPKAQADWLAKSISTVDAVEELNLGRWRSVINLDVRVGIMTAIMQTVCLTKLMADNEKSLASDKTDAASRLYAGVASVVVTSADVIGNALARRAQLGMRFGQGLASTSADFFKILGKWGGVAIGLFMAALDGVQAYTAYKEHASGLVVVAYIGSAVVGASLSLAIFAAAYLGAAAIPIIGVLVLLLIGISILIEYIKDNPVQNWLKRCPWGNLTEERYPNMSIEQAELLQALK
jgi:hypothetical protein